MNIENETEQAEAKIIKDDQQPSAQNCEHPPISAATIGKQPEELSENSAQTESPPVALCVPSTHETASVSPAVIEQSNACTSAAASDSTSIDKEYCIKWIEFNQRIAPIVLQNENGPCPLISICNVLFLRGDMHLDANLHRIAAHQLIHKLADALFNTFIPRLLESKPSTAAAAVAANAASSVPSSAADDDRSDLRSTSIDKNIDDALAIFEKLQVGLDVNVKFSDVRHFEYTRELDIFDLFDVGIFHGWLIDPQETQFYKHLAQKSYNQLVELMLLRHKSKAAPTDDRCADQDDENLVCFLAESFLESTASQLTYYGLTELYAAIRAGQLCVFFRNNHFSTLYKNQTDEKLYVLVTDQGYVNHSNVAWETLENIEGDGELCDHLFRKSSQHRTVAPTTAGNISESDRCKNDYLLALSMQENSIEEVQSNQDISNQNVTKSDGKKTTKEQKDKTCIIS